MLRVVIVLFQVVFLFHIVPSRATSIAYKMTRSQARKRRCCVSNYCVSLTIFMLRRNVLGSALMEWSVLSPLTLSVRPFYDRQTGDVTSYHSCCPRSETNETSVLASCAVHSLGHSRIQWNVNQVFSRVRGAKLGIIALYRGDLWMSWHIACK